MRKKIYWLKVDFDRPIKTLRAMPKWLYSGAIYEGDDISHISQKDDDTQRVYIYYTQKACDKAAAQWLETITKYSGKNKEA